MVVKNYRTLVDVDIALTPLTVFVGKNGVGKSNVGSLSFSIKALWVLKGALCFNVKRDEIRSACRGGSRTAPTFAGGDLYFISKIR